MTLVVLGCLAQPWHADAASGPRDVQAGHRFVTLGAETGFNSLSGASGLFAAYRVLPDLSLDAGLGPSLDGTRLGMQVRYLWRTGKHSPFVAAGPLLHFDNPHAALARIFLRSRGIGPVGVSLQGTAGYALYADQGFTLLFSAGWSQALCMTTQTAIVTFLNREVKTFRYGRNIPTWLMPSGPVLSVMAGYSF